MNVVIFFDNRKICNHGERKRLSDIHIVLIRYDVHRDISYSEVRG